MVMILELFLFQYALHVYDTLQMHGKNYGLMSAGYYALRTLRTEKFFAYWGTDLTPFCTPFECGREFRVKLDVSSCKNLYIIFYIYISILEASL